MESVVNRERIEQIMADRDLSYTVLAAMVSERLPRGVSRQALQQFVAGKHSLNVDAFAALAAALGVGVSDLLVDVVSA